MKKGMRQTEKAGEVVSRGFVEPPRRWDRGSDVDKDCEASRSSICWSNIAYGEGKHHSTPCKEACGVVT